MIRCGTIALVTGTHVGAFKVGAGTVSADLWLQALVHIKTLSVPASKTFRAGDTLVRAWGIHTLFIGTSAWRQTLIDILAVSSPRHTVPAVTVFAPEGPYGVDAATLPTHIEPQTFIHIYAASALLTGHKPCWANTQETSLCVLTATLGAEVWGLSTFVNVNAFPLLLAEPVAVVANAGVPHRQVDAVACPTDVWVHGALVDLCHLSRSNHLTGTRRGSFGSHFDRHRG